MHRFRAEFYEKKNFVNVYVRLILLHRHTDKLVLHIWFWFWGRIYYRLLSIFHLHMHEYTWSIFIYFIICENTQSIRIKNLTRVPVDTNGKWYPLCKVGIDGNKFMFLLKPKIEFMFPILQWKSCFHHIMDGNLAFIMSYYIFHYTDAQKTCIWSCIR